MLNLLLLPHLAKVVEEPTFVRLMKNTAIRSSLEVTVQFSEGIFCKIDEKYVEVLLFFLTRSETRDMSLAPHWACNQDLFQRTVIGHSDFKI